MIWRYKIVLLYFSCRWRNFDTHITRNNCGFPKGFFEFSPTRFHMSAENQARMECSCTGLTIDHAAAFDFHRCRQRRYLANWIYIPRLLDLCQIGCTWFRSTYPEHYGILYDSNADPARVGARPSSTARFYDIKFQRRAQMTDLRWRTVPDDMNRRHKRTLQQENTSIDVKAFSARDTRRHAAYQKYTLTLQYQ